MFPKNRWAALLLVIFLGLANQAGAEIAAPTEEQLAKMCAGQAGCELVSTRMAGQALDDGDMAVVQLKFAMTDEMKEDPTFACRDMDDWDQQNGGYEYWLLKGQSEPRKILSLCNDGYGAAGVGEDIVTVEENLLVHIRRGGSAWRWDTVRRVQLDPLHIKQEESCSYHNVSAQTGVIQGIDYETMRVRSTAMVGEAPFDDPDSEEEIGCPVLYPDPVAMPEEGIANGFDIIAPLYDQPQQKAELLVEGTLLGDCALTLSTASNGEEGFIVYGEAAAANEAAEIKVIAESNNTLLIQVTDQPPRLAAKAKSWIHEPHLEIWTASEPTIGSNKPSPEFLQQIGITLFGNKVHEGFGNNVVLPEVTRWIVKEKEGWPTVVMRITWPEELWLVNGVTVVYSQAVENKQTRLVANAGIEKNRPLYLPRIAFLKDPEGSDLVPAPHCEVKDGVLTIVGAGG